MTWGFQLGRGMGHTCGMKVHMLTYMQLGLRCGARCMHVVSGSVLQWYFLPSVKTNHALPLLLLCCLVGARTWYEQEGGGRIPWPAGVTSDPGPVLPRTTVLDRYSQHVAGCKSCSKALAWAQRLQVGDNRRGGELGWTVEGTANSWRA